jgi:hypothetical protein
MFFVCESISKRETHNLVDPIICRCQKHRQLACHEGGFATCYPLNVSIVHSPKLTIIADSNCKTDIGFVLGETIRFRSLEFIADCYSSLSLSLPRGMTHLSCSWEWFTVGHHHGIPFSRNPSMRVPASPCLEGLMW